MIDNILLGIEVAFNYQNFLYLVVGVLLGTLVGILPGLGPASSISILLPATFYLGPVTGMIFLAGLYYGSQYGGSTTAILLNTPGENSAIMTCIDGNKMAKAGRAGPAIMAAALSSFIAGIIMAVVMAVVAPPLAEIAFKFGPAEYTLIMLFGFISVILLTGTDLLTGLSLAFLGMMFGLIGTDINSGIDRFTFNIPELMDGINFSCVAMGLFAVSEIFKSLINSKNITSYTSNVELYPNKEDVKRVIPAALRGTLVGGFLGLLPGGGITISSYVGYAVEKKLSKNKQEIGNGAIEGVAAPEAANNASAQAGLIPLLSLGLPENAVMALLLGSMLVAGIVPGPMVLTQHPDLFWGLVISMLIGNSILLFLNYPLVRVWIQILKVPYNLLYPSILAICFLGTYAINYNPNDVMILAGFVVLGYIFLILDLSPITFILGFVLGPMFEDNFRRSLSISQGDISIFYKTDIGIGLIIMIGLFLVLGIYKSIKVK